MTWLVSTAVLLFCFLLLAAIRVNIPFALVGSSLIVLGLTHVISLNAAISSAVNTFPNGVGLIALPLFLFTGTLLTKSGLATILLDAANALVGRIRGGLALVNIVASFLFGGISGSAAADAAGLGQVLIPEMEKKGYDTKFSAVVTMTSACLGPIVPPSVIAIVFSLLTGASISAMFMAGYIPGLMLVVALSALSVIYAIKRNYPIQPPLSMGTRAVLLIKAIPVLMTIVIIIGGLIWGIFTATEAGAVAAVYSFVLGLIYRKITWKVFVETLESTVENTGIVCLLLAFAAVVTRLSAFLQIPAHAAEFISSISPSPIPFLFFVMILYIMLGALLNPVSILTITVPVLYPIANLLGVSTIHFGIVSLVTLAIGHVTPPVGIALFVTTSVAKLSMEEVIPTLLPFILAMILVSVALILFPGLSLWLPTVTGLIK